MSPKLIAVAMWATTGVMAILTLILSASLRQAVETLSYVLTGGACTASIRWSLRGRKGTDSIGSSAQQSDVTLFCQASHVAGRISERLSLMGHPED